MTMLLQMTQLPGQRNKGSGFWNSGLKKYNNAGLTKVRGNLELPSKDIIFTGL